MAYLRATKKVLSVLPAPTTPDEEPVENALGDWFVNRVVIVGQPLLVVISSTSLLPIVTPANNVRGLPDRLWKLGETPRHAGRRSRSVIWPNEKTVELIWSRWAPGESRAPGGSAAD